MCVSWGLITILHISFLLLRMLNHHSFYLPLVFQKTLKLLGLLEGQYNLLKRPKLLHILSGHALYILHEDTFCEWLRVTPMLSHQADFFLSVQIDRLHLTIINQKPLFLKSATYWGS